jgi:hypothetical protein
VGGLPGGAPQDASDLSARHQRVRDYLAFYLDRRGHLPTYAELAEACRLRSSSTAHGVVRDLERIGLLIRDPSSSRLARMSDDGPGPVSADEDGEIWVILRMLEQQSRCELDWARDGLALSGDLALLDWILQRAQQHLARLRSYEHIRVLLRPPDLDTRHRMEEIEVTMTRAARAYQPLKQSLDTWFAYSTMGYIATLRMSRNISSESGLLAMHLALDTDVDPTAGSDWQFCSRALEHGDYTLDSAAQKIISISDEATADMRMLVAREFTEIVPVQAVTIDDLVAT